ncbi:MAG: hypothetical protein ABWZ76_03990 [Acidimicrobiales bacterium]
MTDLVTGLTDEDIRTQWIATNVPADGDDDATDPGDATDSDDDGTDDTDDDSDGTDA